MIETTYDFNTMVEKIVTEDLKLTPKEVYRILSGDAAMSWIELITNVTSALLDKVECKDEEGKRNWICYYETVATDVAKRYLLSMSFDEFNASYYKQAYTYMQRAFMILTGCTYEQANDLTDSFIELRDIHACLFDHLFSRNINLCNCKEVRFEIARGLSPNLYIIRTVRDNKNCNLSKHCDYCFKETKSNRNMFIDMYSSDKEMESEV